VPWEITIINGTLEQPQPLGTREEVVAAFAEALPGVLFKAPPPPPPKFLGGLPTFVQEAFTRPSLEAVFEGEDLSIEFRANDIPILEWVNAEVRGNGDPLPALAALCLDRGWSVINADDNSVVNLAACHIRAWERFRKCRDWAIVQSLDSGRTEEQ
jgi:hypothetical protein